MKILIHKNREKLLRVISSDMEEIVLKSTTCKGALWELAEKFPDELIGWCEENLQQNINFEKWFKVFKHDLIMATYGVDTTFLPDSIGYVDQLAFVKVNRNVRYPTWLMSTDAGGINGRVLLRFKELFSKETNLGYILTSVAKIGQQNGLFCYSDPGLVNEKRNVKPVAIATSEDLFNFVYQHYTSWWTTILLYCLKKYEKTIPLRNYFKAFLKKKEFRSDVELSDFVPSLNNELVKGTIDVIIPTLARKEYLQQVLEDLKKQRLIPKNVIIVEQDPDEGSQSQLKDIVSRVWPFKIIPIFTHQTGACNARNLALDEVQSEWIFFADDDIRIESDLLKRVMEEASRYQISALNLNCMQPGEETIFHKVKQWGSFGAGTSVVKTYYAQQCRFSKVFEYGFGEDVDFGMQLRNIGCDIIYHPALQLLHLKAPTGGFRNKPKLPWEKEEIVPKPSPTLMAYALKHFTHQQLRGYKVSLFLKFYRRQAVKNPIRYFRLMKLRWRKSEEWASKLLNQNSKSALQKFKIK